MNTNAVKLLGTLNSSDIGAERIEVYNLDTLEVPKWVQAVNVQDGWIDQLVCVCEDPLIFKTLVGPTRGDDTFVTQRVTGNWGVRRAEYFGGTPKPAGDRKHDFDPEVALEQARALEAVNKEKSQPA